MSAGDLLLWSGGVAAAAVALVVPGGAMLLTVSHVMKIIEVIRGTRRLGVTDLHMRALELTPDQARAVREYAKRLGRENKQTREMEEGD